MKIIVIIKRDLEGCIALNYILKHIPAHDYTVILSDKFTKTERDVKEFAQFVFYERDLLVHQIFPLIERAVPQKESPQYLTFNRIKKKYQISLTIADDINNDTWENRIQTINPDIILSVRNDFIFKKNILDIPKLGIYNVHPGTLPEYRGVYAPFRAMLNGEQKVGCTLHRVDQGIDTGAIVGIKTMNVDYSRSVLWHMCKLYPIGIDIFKEMLLKFENNEEVRTYAQDELRMRYYSFANTEEFQIFCNQGHKLIDHGEYLEFLSGFTNSTS